MAAAVWNYPTRVLFGEGAISEIGNEARKLGMKRVLIVTDPGVVKAGLLGPIERVLAASEVTAERFDGISSNPTEAESVAAGDAYRGAGPTA